MTSTDNIIFKDKVFYKSDHIILDKESYTHDLQDFSFTFIELPKFKITDINLLTNIVEKWCYFFKHADETSEADLLRIIGSDQVIERAYEELNQFNWTEEELLTYEQETKRTMDNKAAEDYLIKTAKAEGKAEGEAKGKADMIKMLIKNGHSVEEIAKMTRLSVTKINELLKIQF